VIRFTWGLLLGLVVGGVLALLLFAEPLCKSGIRSRLGGALDDAGLGGLKNVLGGLI
jgi:hypothetical protein